MAHFFENAQELHTALMTCASTAPTEWDSENPHVTFKAPHRLADGSKPLLAIKNTRARLIEFAQTVAKSPRLFGGGKVDKPTRTAHRSPWPAGAVKLVRELLQDRDYAGALELADSKTGAMFYQNAKQAFMLLAPMECPELPGLMSAQNESGVFVVFDPVSGHAVNGRSLSRPQRTRAGAISEAVDVWGEKTPEQQAEALARAHAAPCDQQAARAAWLTEHGIVSTEDTAARIEAQQAQESEAMEEAAAPSAAPASTEHAPEEAEIDAPVLYRGQRWTMGAARAFIGSMRAAIADNTREIDTARSSRKAGAADIIHAMEIKRRARTDMLADMLTAVASASAAQVVAQATAAAAIEQASTSAAAPRVVAPVAALATVGAYADRAQVVGYATAQRPHPAGTGHSMGTTTRHPARPYTPPRADYTDPRETLTPPPAQCAYDDAIFCTPATRYGKTQWTLCVYLHPRYGACTGYSWLDETCGVWRQDKFHPRYDGDDTYNGLPLSLGKLYDAHKGTIADLLTQYRKPPQATPMTTTKPTPATPPKPRATMTGAELQTMREACNLTREEFAGLVGVEARTLKHWENGRSGVPADVVDVLQRIDYAVAQATAQALIALRKLGAQMPKGAALGDMVMVRYRTAQDLAHYHPDMKGLPLGAHGAIVQRIRNGARYLPGFEAAPVRIVWMDPQAYEAWRAACHMADSEATRSQWASEQLALQAIPHRADQPPAA